MELEVYRDTRNTVLGRTLIQEVQHFIDQHSSSVPEDYKLLLWYQFAHIQLMHGEYDQALHWTNSIINRRFTNGRKDMQCFARWLNLVVHLELGKYMVLRYSVDQTRRFLKKGRSLAPYEKVLLQFFSRISRRPKAEWPQIRAATYEQLFTTDPPLAGNNVLDYFDFKAWLGGSALS